MISLEESQNKITERLDTISNTIIQFERKINLDEWWTEVEVMVRKNYNDADWYLQTKKIKGQKKLRCFLLAKHEDDLGDEKIIYVRPFIECPADLRILFFNYLPLLEIAYKKQQEKDILEFEKMKSTLNGK
jgi:hypothetical protein